MPQHQSLGRASKNTLHDLFQAEAPRYSWFALTSSATTYQSKSSDGSDIYVAISRAGDQAGVMLECWTAIIERIRHFCIYVGRSTHHMRRLTRNIIPFSACESGFDASQGQARRALWYLKVRMHLLWIKLSAFCAELGVDTVCSALKFPLQLRRYAAVPPIKTSHFCTTG